MPVVVPSHCSLPEETIEDDAVAEGLVGKFVFTNAHFGDLEKHKKNKKNPFGIEAHVGCVLEVHAGVNGEMDAVLEEWKIAADEDGDVPNTFVRETEVGSQKWVEPVGALYYARVLAPPRVTPDGDETVELDANHMNNIADGEMQRIMDKDAGLTDLSIAKRSKRRRTKSAGDENKENGSGVHTASQASRKRKPTDQGRGLSTLQALQNTLRQSKEQRLRKAQQTNK